MSISLGVPVGEDIRGSASILKWTLQSSANHENERTEIQDDRKVKVTPNLKHTHPVQTNARNQTFIATKPNEVLP